MGKHLGIAAVSRIYFVFKYLNLFLAYIRPFDLPDEFFGFTAVHGARNHFQVANSFRHMDIVALFVKKSKWCRGYFDTFRIIFSIL